MGMFVKGMVPGEGRGMNGKGMLIADMMWGWNQIAERRGRGKREANCGFKFPSQTGLRSGLGPEIPIIKRNIPVWREVFFPNAARQSLCRLSRRHPQTGKGESPQRMGSRVNAERLQTGGGAGLYRFLPV